MIFIIDFFGDKDEKPPVGDSKSGKTLKVMKKRENEFYKVSKTRKLWLSASYRKNKRRKSRNPRLKSSSGTQPCTITTLASATWS